MSLKNNAIFRYLRDTRAEMRNVTWPTRREAWNLTLIVLAVTFVMTVFLGALDFLLTLEFRGILVDRNIVAIVVGVLILVGCIVAAVILGRQTS